MLLMLKRLCGRLVVAAGLAVALIGTAALPAGAAGIGAGTASGTLTVAPGLTATGTQATTFSLAPTSVVGVFDGADATTGTTTVDDTATGLHAVAAGAATYAGALMTGTITGASIAETCAGGVGTTNPFDFSGTTTVGPVAGQTLTSTITGHVDSGLYVRVGPVAITVLLGVVTLLETHNESFFGLFKSLSKSHSTGGMATFAAMFVPDPGQDCVTVPVTSASVAGAFAVVTS